MDARSVSLMFLILVVVFISGCIGDSTTSGNKGVMISDFSPDISEIYSGDEVVFTAVVENAGEEDAKDVEVRIFGLGNDWNIPDKTYEIGFLEKMDSDIPGGTGEAYWEATSPSSLKVDNVYTATIRMTYNYQTTAVGNIKVYDSDYIKSVAEDAEAIMSSNGLESFTVTDSPITVELSGLSKPIISKGSTTSSLTVIVKNAGSGKPFNDDEDDMTVVVEKIKVGDNTPCVSNQQIKLPRSGQKSVACSFTLGSIDSYTTIPVEVVLSYNYFVDESTQITVLKALFIEDNDDNGGYTDTTKPVISSAGVSGIDSDSATVSWATNEKSDSDVWYGTACTSSKLTKTSKSSMVKSHEISLRSLVANTKYYYRIESTDASDNTGKYPSSGCSSFTTLSSSGTSTGSDIECYINADCCSNVEKSDTALESTGPCGLNEGAYCDSSNHCHCGSTYTKYETCPPFEIPKD